MSSRLLNSLPYEDGFHMPAEFEPQRAVWMIFASNGATWYNGCIPAQRAQVEMVKAINAAGTPVHIGVAPGLWLQAEQMLKGLDVTLYEMTSDDNWVRDTGAICVRNDATGEVRGVDFKFNAYGGEKHGASMYYAVDDLIARKMLQAEGLDRYRTSFILEGGSVICDGEGTAIVTESCLLNENRNPEYDREGIEKMLHDYLGFEKVIWLKSGVDNEEGETDGHVDDVCAFLAPGEVVTCYTEDRENPYYEVFRDCYETLSHAVDAKGRGLTVHKLTAAAPFAFTEEEAENLLAAQGVGKEEDGHWRKAGEAAVPSYANFLITNGSIIFPVYGLATDEEAVACMERIAAGRFTVRPVPAHDIALGGGSVHCTTQQIPR
ncbi:MAG: agmatine deiminase [Clostridiales bacterium]|nr:agmatine deiminase [Clostridiales bacterium]